MRTVGALEAKTRLSQLLDQVEAGERITITRHGEPVAVLVPAHAALDKGAIAKVIAQIRKARKGAGHVRNVKALVEAGRKY